MTWREKLRRVTMPDGRRLIGASFRGVPFFVESSDRTGGRRAVVHEFPLRDDPYVEDLGRRARSFPVDGYVLGDDYLDQRDALLEALEETSGPGELVHPYHGTRKAICERFTVRETVAECGMARVSMEFTETPAQAVTPTDAPDFAGTVSLSADSAIGAISSDFTSVFDAGLPTYALASASLSLKTMSLSLGAALAPIMNSTQELAKMRQQIDIIVAQASSLIRTPGSVLGAFQNVIASLAETILNAPGSVLGAFTLAYMTDLDPLPPETTPTRQHEHANRVAIDGALKGILACEAARLSPQVDFDTVSNAIATRDQVVDMLDELAATAGDTVYPALVQLRADVVRAVPGENEFARQVTVERRQAIPTILLSYQLYGTTEREDDILARNQTDDPNFIAGTLEVLSE